MWTPGCSLPHSNVFLSINSSGVWWSLPLYEVQVEPIPSVKGYVIQLSQETPEHSAAYIYSQIYFCKCAQAALVYPAWPPSQSLATCTFICSFFYQPCSCEGKDLGLSLRQALILRSLGANPRPASTVKLFPNPAPPKEITKNEMNHLEKQVATSEA